MILSNYVLRKKQFAADFVNLSVNDLLQISFALTKNWLGSWHFREIFKYGSKNFEKFSINFFSKILKNLKVSKLTEWLPFNFDFNIH